MRSANVHLTFKIGVTGLVTFIQQDRNSPVGIKVDIKTIPDTLQSFLPFIHFSSVLDGLHAFHINTYGDISEGARSTGDIFNPNDRAPPIGQLQDIEAIDGRIETHQASNQISLFDGENSIIGRSVVIYSHTAPDLGDAIGWGIIGVSP